MQGAMSSPGSRSCSPRLPRCCRSCRSCSCRSRSHVSIARWPRRRPSRPQPYAWRRSCDARRAVLEGRWRAAVARRVSTCGERNIPDHHADLRRVMAERVARQPGMVLAALRRARATSSSRSTIATRRSGSGPSRSSMCGRRSTGSRRTPGHSAAIRAASCWSADRRVHSSRCGSRIRKVPPPYAAS